MRLRNAFLGVFEASKLVSTKTLLLSTITAVKVQPNICMRKLEQLEGTTHENFGFRGKKGQNPTVPQGHRDRVTTLRKSRGPPQNPAEPRRDPAEPSKRTPQRPLRTLREATFLGEPRRGLCPSDGDPPEL